MNKELIQKFLNKACWDEQAEVDIEDFISVEKFAQLIVRECVDIGEAHARSLEAQPYDPDLEQYEDGIINGIYEATTVIKQHFGVEE